jgi:uncharacterized protein YidB (DUF937 family)
MGVFDNLVSGVARSILTGLETQALPAVLARVLGNTDLGSIGGLLQALQQGGLDRQVASWLGSGGNLPISVDQLRGALGDARIRQMAAAAGLPIDQLLDGLAQKLPETIDHMSPNGTLEEGGETAGQGGSLADQAGLKDIGER